MSDNAFNLLREAMRAKSVDQQLLWIVDENITASDIASITPAVNLLVMTNRYDLAEQLRQNGFSVSLSDYDFSSIENHSLDAIFYRVSKEKAVVHHIVNAAAKVLKPMSSLFLVGSKNEGIKTYAEKAAVYLGALVDKQRGRKASLLAELRYEGEAGELLDDKNYSHTQVVSSGDMSFISKPGVYGWNKIDKGSAFLIENFSSFIESLPTPPETVADLGCGYGYLSVMAGTILPVTYLATDNSVAAVDLCQQNFSANSINGSVVLADCADGIVQKFDLVLCNPPFHQGFDVDSGLTLKFIAAARGLLKQGGSALFVVNSFIPLEKKAETFFSDISQLANNGSFKLVVLTA